MQNGKSDGKSILYNVPTALRSGDLFGIIFSEPLRKTELCEVLFSDGLEFCKGGFAWDFWNLLFFSIERKIFIFEKRARAGVHGVKPRARKFGVWMSRKCEQEF